MGRPVFRQRKPHPSCIGAGMLKIECSKAAAASGWTVIKDLDAFCADGTLEIAVGFLMCRHLRP